MVYYVLSPTRNRRDPACLYYTTILTELKNEFIQSEKGKQRGTWFVYPLL